MFGILSCTVYAAFIALILFGGEYAGRGKFFDRPFEKESLLPLRGIAAAGVLLHHLAQEDAFEDITRELCFFRKIGFLLVAVFLFSSGYGLMKSLSRKPGYLESFTRKRFPEILVPFYVNVLIYGIVMPRYVGSYAPIQWVTNSLGLTMMNTYGWYPVALFLLYAAFLFIFRRVKNPDAGIMWMLGVVLFMGCIFCIGGHFPWWTGTLGWWLGENAISNAPWWKHIYVFWFGGEWWVNSVIAFVVGLIYGQHEEKIRNWFERKYWLKTAGCLLLFAGSYRLFRTVDDRIGYWSEFSKAAPGIGDKFICYFSQLPSTVSFVLLISALLMKFRTSNAVSRFFGKISFETYLMNLLAIYVFRFLEFKWADGGWQAVVWGPCHLNLILFSAGVLALSIASGWAVHILDRYLIGFFQRLNTGKKPEKTAR